MHIHFMMQFCIAVAYSATATKTHPLKYETKWRISNFYKTNEKYVVTTATPFQEFPDAVSVNNLDQDDADGREPLTPKNFGILSTRRPAFTDLWMTANNEKPREAGVEKEMWKTPRPDFRHGMGEFTIQNNFKNLTTYNNNWDKITMRSNEFTNNKITTNVDVKVKYDTPLTTNSRGVINTRHNEITTTRSPGFVTSNKESFTTMRNYPETFTELGKTLEASTGNILTTLSSSKTTNTGRDKVGPDTVAATTWDRGKVTTIGVFLNKSANMTTTSFKNDITIKPTIKYVGESGEGFSTTSKDSREVTDNIGGSESTADFTENTQRKDNGPDDSVSKADTGSKEATDSAAFDSAGEPNPKKPDGQGDVNKEVTDSIGGMTDSFGDKAPTKDDGFDDFDKNKGKDTKNITEGSTDQFDTRKNNDGPKIGGEFTTGKDPIQVTDVRITEPNAIPNNNTAANLPRDANSGLPGDDVAGKSTDSGFKDMNNNDKFTTTANDDGEQMTERKRPRPISTDEPDAERIPITKKLIKDLSFTLKPTPAAKDNNDVFVNATQVGGDFLNNTKESDGDVNPPSTNDDPRDVTRNFDNSFSDDRLTTMKSTQSFVTTQKTVPMSRNSATVKYNSKTTVERGWNRLPLLMSGDD